MGHRFLEEQTFSESHLCCISRMENCGSERLTEGIKKCESVLHGPKGVSLQGSPEDIRGTLSESCNSVSNFFRHQEA